MNSNCLKESCFPECWNVSLMVPVFKNVRERSTTKNYHPVSFFSEVSKVFVVFFQISRMVLGILDQLQIF